MLKKIKEAIKKRITCKKGNEMIALALVLIFVILAAAPFLKDLGKTTGDGIKGLNTQMEDVLSGSTD